MMTIDGQIPTAPATVESNNEPQVAVVPEVSVEAKEASTVLPAPEEKRTQYFQGIPNPPRPSRTVTPTKPVNTFSLKHQRCWAIDLEPDYHKELVAQGILKSTDQDFVISGISVLDAMNKLAQSQMVNMLKIENVVELCGVWS
jgi:hypothetical protein